MSCALQIAALQHILGWVFFGFFQCENHRFAPRTPGTGSAQGRGQSACAAPGATNEAERRPWMPILTGLCLTPPAPGWLHAGCCSAPFAVARVRPGQRARERLWSPARPGTAATLGIFFSSRKLKYFLLQPPLLLAERVLQSHRFLFSGRGGASRYLTVCLLVILGVFFSSVSVALPAPTGPGGRVGFGCAIVSSVHAQPFAWCCPLGPGEVGGWRLPAEEPVLRRLSSRASPGRMDTGAGWPGWPRPAALG